MRERERAMTILQSAKMMLRNRTWQLAETASLALDESTAMKCGEKLFLRTAERCAAERRVLKNLLWEKDWPT